MECLKEPSMERPENLKTPVKENQSIIWKSVLLQSKPTSQPYPITQIYHSRNISFFQHDSNGFARKICSQSCDFKSTHYEKGANLYEKQNDGTNSIHLSRRPWG